VYGLITAAHQMLQVMLLSSQGAMAVGLVNAVRASVVSFVSSWVFCSSVTALCLSYWRAVGAMVVTAGATLWVVAGEMCLCLTSLLGFSKNISAYVCALLNVAGHRDVRLLSLLRCVQLGAGCAGTLWLITILLSVALQASP
jgi:hypothetical protein